MKFQIPKRSRRIKARGPSTRSYVPGGIVLRDSLCVVMDACPVSLIQIGRGCEKSLQSKARVCSEADRMRGICSGVISLLNLKSSSHPSEFVIKACTDVELCCRLLDREYKSRIEFMFPLSFRFLSIFDQDTWRCRKHVAHTFTTRGADVSLQHSGSPTQTQLDHDPSFTPGYKPPWIRFSMP
jgi:hypothetical protein